MIHVLVEASSPDLQAEIAGVIRDHPEFRLIDSSSEAAPGDESQPRPDVVLIAAEHGEPAFESFGWHAAGVPIILVADNPARLMTERWILEALPAGVRAILPRNVTAAEMIAAIEAVAAGLLVFHPSDADSLPIFRSRQAETASEDIAPLAEPLTPREIEVLQLLSAGLGNKEIASRLNISEHTAKFHVASIMGKLGATSRTEAVTLGIRRGLVMI